MPVKFMNNLIKETGITPCRILLPKTDDLTAWACVACDQFTGKKEYWKSLERFVGDKKSALKLVLPEAYLNDDADERIKSANRNIENYLKDGVFEELPEGFILTVRKTPYVKRRIGLIGAVDLEKYDFSKGSRTLVRATEGTIEERIPPRLKIRRNAAAEFSHIMILFDDERCEITEELYENRDKLKKLYDFELNMGGGSVEGYFVEDYKSVSEAFSKLSDKERLIKKYGKADEFIFAVGDGNHSLATAKAFWDEIKTGLTEEEKKTHPARFALAEFVNVYDEGIYFEPIYRFADGVNAKNFADGLKDVTDAKFSVYRGGKESFYGSVNNVPEAIKAVDEYVNNYITAHGGKVDYIHGEEEVKKMADADENSVAILFSAINKSDLFRYVSENGAFPRKTFSMGEGEEKRYYLEGKRIK